MGKWADGVGGFRMFIPVGGAEQFIWVIDKTEDGTVKRTKSFGVLYVPLTDAPEVLES